MDVCRFEKVSVMHRYLKCHACEKWEAQSENEVSHVIGKFWYWKWVFLYYIVWVCGCITEWCCMVAMLSWFGVNFL